MQRLVAGAGLCGDQFLVGQCLAQPRHFGRRLAGGAGGGLDLGQPRLGFGGAPVGRSHALFGFGCNPLDLGRVDRNRCRLPHRLADPVQSRRKTVFQRLDVTHSRPPVAATLQSFAAPRKGAAAAGRHRLVPCAFGTACYWGTPSAARRDTPWTSPSSAPNIQTTGFGPRR